jgi:hypothetical protein
MKKLKSYDYLFYLQDPGADFNPTPLTKKMRESGIFRAIFVLDPNEVNNNYLQNLIP